jgi:hypothetical protein
MEMLSWVRDFVAREWSDVAEGIAETTASQLFRVYPPAAGMYERAVELFNVATTASTGGNATYIRTDGEQIYYVGGSPPQLIIAADPADGSELWESSPAVASAHRNICTDGGFVYSVTTGGAPAGLLRYSRSTGAYDTNGGTDYNNTVLVTNGEYCIGVDGSVAGAGKITFWSGIQGTITQAASYYDTTSAGLIAAAIGDTQCYVGGTRATYDVWCVRLSDRATRWRTTLATTIAPTVRGIATDGDHVFVATDLVALTAGGSANLFVLNKQNGTVQWNASLAGGGDLRNGIAVDDRYLYVCDNAGTTGCYIYRVRAPTLVLVGQITGLNDPVLDGVSVTGQNDSDLTKFRRHWMLGATKTFMRAASSDPNRRPFFTLAVPVDGRI